MFNTLIIGICVFAAVMGISVATWSILRTRAMVRTQQQSDRIERTAHKLYLVVMDMLARVLPNRLSPENIQPYTSLPEETKDLYRDLAKRYFEDVE